MVSTSFSIPCTISATLTNLLAEVGKHGSNTVEDPQFDSVVKLTQWFQQQWWKPLTHIESARTTIVLACVREYQPRGTSTPSIDPRTIIRKLQFGAVSQRHLIPIAPENALKHYASLNTT